MKLKNMNASEARILSDKSKTEQINLANLRWIEAQDFIFEKIEESARFGNSSVKIDMRDERLLAMNKYLDKMKSELKELGFDVDYLLQRTPDGIREMIVKW